MQEKDQLRVLLWFNIAFLVMFTLYALWKRNYEFVYYSALTSAIMIFIMSYHRQFHLTKGVLFGLSFFLMLSVLGSNMYINGTRLFEMWLVQPHIIKYDNLVHFFGNLVVTFAVYSVLHKHLDEKMSSNPLLMLGATVLIVMGIGAFSEVVEFIAVLFLGAAEQVGDYFNNAFDLVCNLLGSLTACFFIVRKRKKETL